MGNIARRRATPAKPSSSVDGCQESFTTVVTLLGPARSAQGVVNFNQPVLLLTLSCSAFWTPTPEGRRVYFLRSLSRNLSSSFYRLLETLLFDRAWAGSASE